MKKTACVVVFAAALALPAFAQEKKEEKKIDEQTGLVIDQSFELVKGQCGICHSHKLVTQSGKTREGWIESIRWMQRNHGLWDLGTHEPEILNYLEKNYGLSKAAVARRAPLPAHLMPK
jgi:hypothetical protein